MPFERVPSGPFFLQFFFAVKSRVFTLARRLVVAKIQATEQSLQPSTQIRSMSEYASEPPSPINLKVPPHSIEAEQSVLGGLMLNNEAWFDLVEIVRAQDFYRTQHQIIFEAMMALANADEPMDGDETELFSETLTVYRKNCGSLNMFCSCRASKKVFPLFKLLMRASNHMSIFFFLYTRPHKSRRGVCAMVFR